MRMWRCGGCGYLHPGDEAPQQCPKCGASSGRFTQLQLGAVERIKGARFTNSLHMHLFSLLEDARDIADAGMEDGLDRGCVQIFQEVEDFAAELQRKISAELQAHVERGKWG